MHYSQASPLYSDSGQGFTPEPKQSYVTYVLCKMQNKDGTLIPTADATKIKT